MPSIADLMEGLGNKAGESASALDQVADSLEQIDFKKAAEGNEALVATQENLQQQLAILKQQAQDNITASKKLLKQDKISGKAAKQISDRQVKIIGELDAAIELESKNRVVGIKELNNMTKAVMGVNTQMGKERKLLQANQLGAARFAKNQARAASVWAKSTDRIDDATSGLDKLADRLGTGFIGSGAITKARGVVEKRGGKKAVAGVAAFAVVAALINKLMGLRGEGIGILTPKLVNYGLQGAKDLDAAIARTTATVADFKAEATELGIDGAEAASIFQEIGAATGSTDKSIKAAGKTLFRVIQLGIIPAGEAASVLSERINTVGMSAYQASREIEDIGLIAKAVGTVQMEDLYKAVTNVAEASGALVTNNRSLATSIGALVRQGDKLGLSYNRSIRAAEGLQKAVSSNYNMGFATIEVERDLALAMKTRDRATNKFEKGMRRVNALRAKEGGTAEEIKARKADIEGRIAFLKSEFKQNSLLAKQAQTITEMRQKGMITDVRAAEMLQEIGGATEKTITQERIKRASMAMVGPGGYEMAQAMLGDFSADTAILLKSYGEKFQKGATMRETFGVGKASRTALKGISKDIAERKDVARKLIDVSLLDFMKSMGKTLDPLLKEIAPAITRVKVTIEELIKVSKTIINLLNKLPGVNIGETEEEGKLKLAKKVKREEEAGTRGTLAMMLRQFPESKQKLPMGYAGEQTTLRDVIGNVPLQQKFRKKFKRGFTSSEKEAIRASAKDVTQEAAAIQMFKTMGSQKITGAKLEKGNMDAEGNRKSTMQIDVEEKGAARAEAEVATVAAGKARAESNVGSL